MSTAYDKDEIRRIQGQSYRSGTLAGQERALERIEATLKALLGNSLTFDPQGPSWVIRESAYKSVVGELSKRLQEELRDTRADAETHRKNLENTP